MGQRWNDTDRGKSEELVEKPVPVSLCLPQIPHGLPCGRTRASAVRIRAEEHSVITRSLHDVYEMNAYTAYHVCPSVHMIQLKNCWTDLDEI
jgi:hypothetical protein